MLYIGLVFFYYTFFFLSYPFPHAQFQASKGSDYNTLQYTTFQLNFSAFFNLRSVPTVEYRHAWFDRRLARVVITSSHLEIEPTTLRLLHSRSRSNFLRRLIRPLLSQKSILAHHSSNHHRIFIRSPTVALLVVPI